jgi:FeS assembly SUF system protein
MSEIINNDGAPVNGGAMNDGAPVAGDGVVKGGEVAAGGVVKGGEVAAGGVDGAEMRDRIEETLRTVFDPEIPVNIFDLGLVYEIKIDDSGKVKITMTLTAPACPVAGDIVAEVQQKTEALEGVADCHVQLTFDPPWTKEMMTEEAKLELGFL